MMDKSAIFRKCDFQIHTPRDGNWDGKHPEADMQDTVTARIEYADSFIDKCISEGLGAIAITDHHEGIYTYVIVERLQERKKVEDIDFWIFPGMELTCKDSAQALIIFDSDFSKLLFDKCRNILKLPADCKADQPKGIPVELLSFNVDELQRLFDTDPEIKGHFIILPNVTPNGHKTILRTGFHKRFNEMPYVGGYLDAKYPEDLKSGDLRILNGEIPAWSSEKRGVISTSDARHADFRLIGKHATWIKLGAPTTEAIRQAMLAPGARIRYSSPEIPNVIIKSLKVTNSKFIKTVHFEFNPQLNSIIGGRGSGKSTLLEYIKFALGWSVLDLESSELASVERLQTIVNDTIIDNDGGVEAVILLNGATVNLKRNANDINTIIVIVNGEQSEMMPESLRKMIPIQSFVQGELSELSRKNAANKLLTLITDERKSELDEIEREQSNLGSSLNNVTSNWLKHTENAARLNELNTRARSLDEQIKNLSELVTNEDDSAKKIINKNANYESISQNFSNSDDLIKRLKEDSVAPFDRSLKSLEKILELTTLDGFEHVNKCISQAISKIKATKETLKTNADEILADFNKAENDWCKIRTTQTDAYKKETAKLSGKKKTLIDIEKAQIQKHSVLTQKNNIENKQDDLSGSSELWKSHVDKYQTLQKDRIQLVREQIVKVESMSNNLVLGELSDSLNFNEVNSAIIDLFQGTGVRSVRFEDLISRLQSSAAPFQRLKELYLELIHISNVSNLGGSLIDVNHVPILNESFEPQQINKLLEKISFEKTISVIKAKVRPSIKLFRLVDGEQIPFVQASQGEQAAGLLTILMNQQNGPLIIDQPEEDLDNRIVGDIIDCLSKTKEFRQLLIATHNANIVVNGDSENVIELQKGVKNTYGAIDNELVRKAITETMEGGEKAFELRRVKYNFGT